MAVTYIGAAPTVAQVTTATVNSATSSDTYILTTGNGASVTYTAGGSDTVTSIAAGLVTLMLNSGAPEFTENTIASLAGVITVTGNANGMPFTLTGSGTGSMTVATPTAPSSPNDVSLAANYSGGAVPTSGTLTLEDTAVDLLWNLSALTNAVSLIRRYSATMTIGLPDVNANGYPEYRPTHLAIKGTSILIEQPTTDQAQQIRIVGTAAGAATVSVLGSGATAQLGSECLEITGLASTSAIYVSAGSVTVAPFAAQTAVVATINGENSTISCGVGVTLTTASLLNCTTSLRCSYTTLTMSGTGNCTVEGSAAGTNTIVAGGTLTWQSTGSPGATPVIGSTGVFDFSDAPASISGITGFTLNSGGSLLDPAGRLAGGYTVTLAYCDVPQVTWSIGVNQTVTVA
jgi:hypothetical protein